MLVRLLFFAGLREALGRKEHALELPEGASLRDALARAEAELPVLARWSGRLLVSVNAERAPLDARLADADEIALLPPVSGGSDACLLSSAPLSVDALLARVRSPECGGEVVFTGAVRNRSRGEAIDHLEYEAYEPMAVREMEKIVAEARARWPDARLAMSHRVGRLAIGEPAVMIAAAAPHRAEAFEACRFAIDELKKRVPIWKKEFAASGAYWVEENP
jgi:molybdopterin synthase catalytic subunit/molybdopterin converting factor small subunit